MPTNERDPYATEHAPKSKSGPLLRFGVVGGLLAAAAVGYMTMAEGPGLTEAPPAEQTTTLADASQDQSYTVAPTQEFAVPEAPAATPAPAAAPRAAAPRAPAPRAEPAPEPVEALPPPTTMTEPTTSPTPLPPTF